MIAALAIAFSALLAAPTAAPPPATITAAASPVPAAPADPPPKPVAERLAELHIMYDQTCVNRAYGAYDDLCESLGDQIRRAEREMQTPHSIKASAKAAVSKPPETPHP